MEAKHLRKSELFATQKETNAMRKSANGKGSSFAHVSEDDRTRERRPYVRIAQRSSSPVKEGKMAEGSIYNIKSQEVYVEPLNVVVLEATEIRRVRGKSGNLCWSLLAPV